MRTTCICGCNCACPFVYVCVRVRACLRMKCSSTSCQKRVCWRSLRSRCRECLAATKILYWWKLYNDLTYVLPDSCKSLDQIHRLKRPGNVSRKSVVWTELIVLVGKFHVNKPLEMLSHRGYCEINGCYWTRFGYLSPFDSCWREFCTRFWSRTWWIILRVAERQLTFYVYLVRPWSV
jgi:hypothetical protein